MPNSQNENYALIFGLAAVLCWSTVATAFKIALKFQNVSTLVFIASCTSLVLLAVILTVQGKLTQAFTSLPQHWKPALLLGLLNPLLYYHVLLWAYDLLPAQVAQPINYTWAIMLALLSVPFLGHKLRKVDLLSLLICYSGVVIISLGGSAAGASSLTGILLALLSTIIWAGYWIFNSRNQRDPIIALFQNFLMVIPFAALMAWPLSSNWQGLASSAYIGIFEMGFAFVLWLYAMKRTRNTSRISNLIFLSPIISLFLIHFILGETIHNTTFFGLALIIGGLAVQNKTANNETLR